MGSRPVLAWTKPPAASRGRKRLDCKGHRGQAWPRFWPSPAALGEAGFCRALGAPRSARRRRTPNTSLTRLAKITTTFSQCTQPQEQWQPQQYADGQIGADREPPEAAGRRGLKVDVTYFSAMRSLKGCHSEGRRFLSARGTCFPARDLRAEKQVPRCARNDKGAVLAAAASGNHFSVFP